MENMAESLMSSGQNTSQNDDSEDDENSIELIEEKILNQNHFGKPANGRLNILQDVQLSPAKPRNPQDQFKKLYSNIKQLPVELPTKFSEKYDYYSFRIPKNINPQLLLNMEINIQEENKIVCEDRKFIIKPTTKIPSPGLLVPGNTMLNFKSNIVMEKYVKPKKYPELKCDKKKPISLPNDLKNRHPLFGSNFEDKIELDEEVRRKLDAAIAKSLRREKKTKKKKIKVEQQAQEEEVIFNLLDNLGTVSNQNTNSKTSLSHDSSIVTQNSASHNKKKSRKTKQSIIDETLRNLKTELLTEYETDTGSTSPKKKKRKEKIKEELPFSETLMDTWPAGLSKKERRMSIANSTLLTDIMQPKFETYMSDISTVNIELTPKKHKRKSGEEIADYKKSKHKKKIH